MLDYELINEVAEKCGASVRGGINWIFIESVDYRVVNEVYFTLFGEPDDNAIWRDNTGVYSFRLHR